MPNDESPLFGSWILWKRTELLFRDADVCTSSAGMRKVDQEQE